MDRVRSWPWYVVPLLIFAASRLVDVVMILVIAPHQLPVSAIPTNLAAPIIVDPPTYFHVIANWDGQWYRIIAEHGYPSHLPMIAGRVDQNPWAFYPLYPGVIRLAMLTGLSFGAAASVVSLACAGAAMCLLYALLAPRTGRYVAALTVLALCVYPAGVTFQMVYTEGPALLMVLAAIWCLRSRHYRFLLVLGLLLALTRPIVLPLAVVVAVHWIARWRARRSDPFPNGQAVELGAVAAVIGASFLLWPAIAALFTGRRDAYWATQRAWRPPGETGWHSWIALMVSGNQIVVGVLALLVLGAFVFRPSARLWCLELHTWALAYPLFVLTSTRPTPSAFRYVMLAIVLCWPFPEIGSVVTTVRARVALATAVASVGFAGQFYVLYTQYIVTSGHRGWP